MDKESFLEKVKAFNREDFQKALYRDIERKQKLLEVVVRLDKNNIPSQRIYKK